VRNQESVQQIVALAILAGLVSLLGLLIPGLTQDTGVLPVLAPRNEGMRDLIPVRQAAALARQETWMELATNFAPARRPFFASIIQPTLKPQSPTTKPPTPPPPATRKVELTYQGHIEDSAGHLQAFIRSGETLLTLTNGATVIADFSLKNIQIDSVLLVSPRGLSNNLPFNKKTSLEIPAK